MKKVTETPMLRTLMPGMMPRDIQTATCALIDALETRALHDGPGAIQLNEDTYEVDQKLRDLFASVFAYHNPNENIMRLPKVSFLPEYKIRETPG